MYQRQVSSVLLQRKWLYIFFFALSLLPLQASAHWTHGESGDPLWYAQDQDLTNAFTKGISPVFHSHKTFVRVGIRWDAPKNLELQIRLSHNGVNWSTWQEVKVTWQESIAHNGHIDPALGTKYAQIRLLGEGLPSFLAVELIKELGPASKIPDPSSEKLPKGIGKHSSALSGPFEARSKWKAKPAKCTSNDTAKKRVAIHHTVTPNNDRVSPEVRLRGIQHYHQKTQGWCDIGYHLLISQDGRAWEGRPAEVLGTNVKYNNTGTLGISYMGTFSTVTPSKKMLCTGSRLVNWAVNTFKIPRNRSYIMGHRQFPRNSTSCPGAALYAKLAQIVKDSSSTTCSGGGPVAKTGKLKGVVFLATDKTMKTRIKGVKVQVKNGSLTTTDGLGYFAFTLKTGTYTVIASKAGYKTASRQVTINANKDTWGSMGLSKQAQPPKDTLAPIVTITFPQNNQRFQQAQIKLRGTAKDKNGVSRLLINGKLSLINRDGSFQSSLALRQGSQVINVEAFDPSGNKGTAQVTVSFFPKQDEKPPLDTSQPDNAHEPPPRDTGSDASTASDPTPRPDQGNQPDPTTKPDTNTNPDPTISPDKTSSIDTGRKDRILILGCQNKSDCPEGELCIEGKCQISAAKTIAVGGGGCSCQQDPSSSGSWLFFVLMALGFGYSRRKKRKKSIE